MATNPTKRSVIFVAFTGEEMGLLGSAYYADHPLIPLNQTVLNLNTDGAGYDDKTAYSVIGYDRVGLVAEFEKAAAEFGLTVIADPAPDQNLFDRSDNVNFAVKGIPAPTISPGTTGFSEEITKHYHQVSDNPDTIDYDYLLIYCKVYAYLSRLIGDKAETPRWKAGDKYESAGKMLYGY
ncbi:MAG: Zn-dependent M28 family amino/carboxypeptidase [Saprospiraceae bacterium]